jgi:hypothetical protein
MRANDIFSADTLAPSSLNGADTIFMLNTFSREKTTKIHRISSHRSEDENEFLETELATFSRKIYFATHCTNAAFFV